MRKDKLLIFDVDNTLMDTSSRFRSAQKSLLDVYESAGLLHNNSTALKNLRKLDRVIWDVIGSKEYDFTILSGAVANWYTEGVNDRRNAVKHAVEGQWFVPDSLINNAARAFEDELSKPAPIFPDTHPTLNEISMKRDFPCIAFTEGDKERIDEAFSSHNLSQYFVDVISQTKTTESFESVKKHSESQLERSYTSDSTVVIGDSMSADILPAERNGYKTIHIPSDFDDTTEPLPEVSPDFRIERLAALTQLTLFS